MWRRLVSLIVASVLVGLLPGGPVHVFGDDDTTSFSFDVAPPPVGYPRIERGARDTTVGGQAVFARGDIVDTSFTVAGLTLFGSLQTNPVRRTMFSLTGGGAFLAGDRMSLMTLQIPLRLLAVIQGFDSDHVDLFLFAGAGGDAGVTSLTVTVPQPVPYTTTFVDDDTTLSVTTTTGTVQAGGQVNVDLRRFVTSVFAVWSYTGGNYSTNQRSSMSYDYPSTSGDLAGRSAVVGGFDLLWKEKNMALSSQIRSDRDFLVYTVALKRLLGSR
jgi:hypothetical protein